MQQKEEGFTGAAGAGKLGARTPAQRVPDGQVHGEAASTAIPPPLSGGESSGGEAAAFRLEKRTYLDTQARYHITHRNYGNGLAEVGWSFVSAFTPSKSSRGLSPDRLANEDRAVRRAKSRLRQLILSGNLTHLLTLSRTSRNQTG